MVDLKNQKRMAAEVLKCGVNRVWIDPEKMEEVSNCITRADIRTAIMSGTIKAKAKNGTSYGRIRKASGRIIIAVATSENTGRQPYPSASAIQPKTVGANSDPI